MPHGGRESDDDGATDEAVLASQRDARIEEERRLMYVAVTRAKRSLTVSWCRQRKRARATLERQPSRFLAEMHLEPEATNNAVVGADDAKRRLAALREMLKR